MLPLFLFCFASMSVAFSFSLPADVPANATKNRLLFFFPVFVRVMPGKLWLFSFCIILPKSLLIHINKWHLCAWEGLKSRGTNNQGSVREAADIIIPNKWQHVKRALVWGQWDPTVTESISQTSIQFSNKLYSVAKPVIFLGPLWNSAVWFYSHKIYLSHVCYLLCAPMFSGFYCRNYSPFICL